MNKGDAYILDIGEAFFVWNGAECSRTERIKVRVLVSLLSCSVFNCGLFNSRWSMRVNWETIAVKVIWSSWKMAKKLQSRWERKNTKYVFKRFVPVLFKLFCSCLMRIWPWRGRGSWRQRLQEVLMTHMNAKRMRSWSCGSESQD